MARVVLFLAVLFSLFLLFGCTRNIREDIAVVCPDECNDSQQAGVIILFPERVQYAGGITQGTVPEVQTYESGFIYVLPVEPFNFSNYSYNDCDIYCNGNENALKSYAAAMKIVASQAKARPQQCAANATQVQSQIGQILNQILTKEYSEVVAPPLQPPHFSLVFCINPSSPGSFCDSIASDLRESKQSLTHGYTYSDYACNELGQLNQLNAELQLILGSNTSLYEWEKDAYRDMADGNVKDAGDWANCAKSEFGQAISRADYVLGYNFTWLGGKCDVMCTSPCGGPSLVIDEGRLNECEAIVGEYNERVRAMRENDTSDQPVYRPTP